jgi:glycine/D-amino acid oxidase-like deaminating enzyme
LNADVIVIGAGIVGSALGYGVARQGRRVIVLDGGDRDLRAARANFGLVWVQGKGAKMAEYADFTLESSDLWPKFLDDLTALVESPVDYARPGGLAFCMSETDFNARTALMKRLHNQRAESYVEMLERPALDRMLPAVTLGPDVVGASFCKADGHVNPLQILNALHAAIPALGGQIIFRNPVAEISPVAGGFRVKAALGCIEAPRVIVAAGLGTALLTEPLGFPVPLRSERGQILVTERLERMLPFPASGIRQTAEGTIMIGATNETVSDRGVTVLSAVELAKKAVRILPALASVRLVRQWSGFRTLPPDGAPIYAESEHYPGLFAAICHSGVTLAAVHAGILAPAMAAGRLPANLAAFSNGRFDVQKCA